jgi:hypothetical protein
MANRIHRIIRYLDSLPKRIQIILAVPLFGLAAYQLYWIGTTLGKALYYLTR